MNNTRNEKISVKCAKCSRIFYISRSEIDRVRGQSIASITSDFATAVSFLSSEPTEITCRYEVIAPKNDFCSHCCIQFLKTGLDQIERYLLE